MRKLLLCVLTLLVASFVAAAETQTQTAPAAAASDSPLKTENDRISYSIGVNIGSNFKSESIQVNTDLLMKGLKDAMAGSKTLLTEEEMRAALTTFQTQIQTKHAEAKQKESSENMKKGEAFLAANKTKEGV